ncbi:hypothetical protein DFH11DRAFT_1730944 [Phellopilus nigrolimitatus]|nr:hypothetical protein DFH11DRAFT_1730944 [Phellopilus nigrolimitatus]
MLNSLTHLTYLTSTSPRIREILTCDGGLRCLVRLLRDFRLSPPLPENPSAIYGPPLLGFPARRPLPLPTPNPLTSTPHTAGTLELVGCGLEAWLTSKGFAVGSSASASGIPRESREQRLLRRQQQLARASTRTCPPSRSRTVLRNCRGTNIVTSDAETTVSTDTSANATPLGSGTPAGTVTVPGRHRSGTVVVRHNWNVDIGDRSQEMPIPGPVMSRSRTVRGRVAESAIPSTSRLDTETEDDADVGMETSMTQDQDADGDMPPPPLEVFGSSPGNSGAPVPRGVQVICLFASGAMSVKTRVWMRRRTSYWTLETDAGGRCQTDEQMEMAHQRVFQDRFDD